MRKNRTWVYVGLTLILILLFSGLLLFRHGKREPVIRSGKPQTAEERSLPAERTQEEKRINVNTADADALQALPGIGEIRAEAIVDYREKNGPFRSISDLMLVKGIGEGTLNKIKDRICLEDEDENTDH